MEQTTNLAEGSPALHRMAVGAAAATFVLIFVGGLVTSTGSGLAVPDWPLAFGKLVPVLEGGVRFEYGHRVVAAIVVLLTAALAAYAWRVEKRRWVRNTALAAVGLILIQAVLGGITVIFELPLAIAVLHAATAQAFFCVMVALAIFTEPRWERPPRREESSASMPLAVLAGLTTATIYVQIIMGALMRHLGAGLAIPDFPLSFGHVVPPVFNRYVAINFAHRCGALMVTALIVWTVIRVLKSHADEPAIRRTALGLILLLAVQLTLGAVTVWSGMAVVPTTTHVAIGATVLATSAALTLRAGHLFGLAHHHGNRSRHAAGAPGPTMMEPRVSA